MSKALKNLRVMAIALVVAVPSVTSAAAQSRNVVTADSNATYHTILSRRNAYQYQLDFTIYFTGQARQAPVPFVDTGVLKRETRPVAAVDLHSLVRNRARLRVCLDDVCQLLDTARYSFPQLPDTAALLRILVTPRGRRGEPEITGKEEVRLEMDSGAVMIQTQASGPFTGSPSIRVTLPQVLDPGDFLAGGPPLFRMDISPLARKLNGDEDESITLDFEGGVRRFRSLFRYGFTYSGSVAADEELAFNSIQAQFEFERNLRPTRYVPLLVTAGAESDQSFDIANAVMTVQGRGLLPIDVNYSPRDSGYIPNARPILTLRLEHGWNVRDENDVAPDNFTRPGYGVRWKVPVARNMVVRLDHDGRWAYGAFFDGAPEYHPMWDAGLEVRQGETTYFLGYRRGEAPPVFREVRAVMAGLVFGVR
jgi:hypothetical protein